MKRLRWLIGLLLLAVALAVAGCSSGDDDKPNNAPSYHNSGSGY